MWRIKAKQDELQKAFLRREPEGVQRAAPRPARRRRRAPERPRAGRRQRRSSSNGDNVVTQTTRKCLKAVARRAGRPGVYACAPGPAVRLLPVLKTGATLGNIRWKYGRKTRLL